MRVDRNFNSIKKKFTSSFSVYAFAFESIFRELIFVKYWLKIYLIKIFFKVFWSKKSIKMSCKILQLFTIASVPLVGEVSNFI
jgi:hypothetical protein